MPGTAKQDVLGSVYITIMNGTAMDTYPASLIQTRLTFRPSNASAFVAGLGGESFRHFFKRRPVRNRFVAEHVSEGRPTGITYGLPKVGLFQSGRVHVSHGYVIEAPHDVQRGFVKMVFAGVSRFRVGLGGLAFFSSALSRCNSLLKSLVVPWIGNLFSGRKRGQLLEAKVNTNPNIDLPRFWCRCFNNDVQVPITQCVLAETAPIHHLPADAAEIAFSFQIVHDHSPMKSRLPEGEQARRIGDAILAMEIEP